MLKKIAVVGMALVMLFSLAACKGKEETETGIDFIIEYNGNNTMFPQDIISIVGTFTEWDILQCDAAQFTGFDAGYNDQFFTENSLIVFAFTTGNGIASTEITSVIVKDKELIVTANIVLNTTDMVGQGLVIIKVKKIDISGVNSVKVIRNN